MRLRQCLLTIALAAMAFATATLHASDANGRHFAGRTLDNVLEDLRGQGIKLIYSSALVTPEMKVGAEPDGKSLRELLDKVLEPHGLRATAGPDDTVVVTKGAQSSSAGKPGVVSFVKVVSDKIEDVSSLEAWKKSFIKDGMTDEEKALAVWTSVVKFRHQSAPPNEYIEGNVHDPIKTFNVYGYGMCCCASSNIEALSRYVGLKAQGRGINRHSVPEVFWDDSWHLLDASLITYFPKPDKKLASVDEIIAGVNDWYEKNPGFKGDDKKLAAFMRGQGWKKGPQVLASCPFYGENGWLPAGTHGWYSTVAEYDGSSKFGYEYGYSQGYQVNVQLRDGERLTRNWFNKGIHVNQLEGEEGAPIGSKIGEGDMAYAPKFGDIAPGRIGNGTLEYTVPLASGAFRESALAAENLACKADSNTAAAVQVKDAAKPGVLIIRMPSSYVYLGGTLNYTAVVSAGGEVKVSFSDNNGITWSELSKATASGSQTVDLKSKVYRRYDYRLKFELTGDSTGLDAVKIVHDIQNSQRALPALGQGKNTITFSTGAAEGTITIEPNLEYGAKTKNLFVTDFAKSITGFNAGDFFMAGPKAELTLPIETPGDLTRIRMGCHYRARGQGEGFEYQVSFDDGKTFKTIDKAEGPTVGNCKYVTFSDIPAGVKSALVRYAGNQNNTCGLFGICIKADYKEPHGGARPVKITYVWDENGTEKTDVHLATKENETYSIECAAKPTMKSLIVELGD
jgi:hypothetical protein